MRATGILTITLAAALAGCRGGISEKPPVHLVLDMDFQQKLKAQSASDFAGWKDGRGMRAPVTGTVKRRSARDQHYHERPELGVWKNSNGTYVTANPVPPTEADLERGREQFFIHCAPCHGRTGEGGLVAKRWPLPVFPNLATDERIRGLSAGELFEVITNGKGTMPSYAKQVEAEDRWRIAHFLEVLQQLPR